MRRRDFNALTGAALVWPLAAPAQAPAVPVIGFLNSGSPGPFAHLVAGSARDWPTPASSRVAVS